VLGIVLKRRGLIDNRFINAASSLVFNIGLPVLLFVTLVQTQLNEVLNLPLLVFGMASTLGLFFLLMLCALLLVPERRDRGVFIQGAIRGNLGIVGLAFCLNAYGERGLALTSLYMAVLTVLYNVLCTYILTHTLADDNSAMVRKVVVNVVKNPIIIGILLALLCLALNVPVPGVLLQSGEYIAAMALPLALLCIGGSLSLKEMRHSSFTSWLTVGMKMVVVPLLMVVLAMAFGFSGMELGIVFLMASAPTATASYVMVQAMRGNGVLAANIVVLSTLVSVVTVSVGIVVLRGMELI